MPNWRKLIVSGSDAHLNSLDVKTFISASEFVGGDFIGDGSQLTNVTASYLSNELTASISGSITQFSSSIVQRVVELESTGSDHESRLDTLEGKSLVSSSAQTDRTWIVGANGFSDYTFSGSGLIGTENDPTLYLTRGEVYRFDIQSGGSHPFRIQSTPNGSAGTPYNDGLSGNDLTSGTLVWNVQFDSPSKLYYQCVNHGSMGGVIHILDKIPEGTVSGSAQLASDISGSFTSLSASIEQRFTTNEVSISSLNNATSSYALIADISGAFAADSSSFEQRITANEGSISSLNSATSSYLLNTTDTLDGDLTVTGKITAQEFHTEFVSASIIYQSGSTKFGDTADDNHAFTGSVNISGSISADNLIGIISSSAQIADEISGSFTSLSSSFESRISLNEITGSDHEVRIDALEGSVSSLNNATSSYALEANISGAFTSLSSSFEQRISTNEGDIVSLTSQTSSYALEANISGAFTSLSSSFEQRISTNEGDITTLTSQTSSYALEANISGAFTSLSQSIASDIEDIIDGTTTVASSSYALTASYALNAGGGAGVGFPFSGSAVITGSLYVSQSFISGSFIGDGSGIEGVVSSSYALTASYALNAAGTDTGSLLTTASAAGSTITFEKGDGSTFDVTISSEVTPANALVTASIAGSTLTFEKGDASTFNLILPAGGYSGSNATAHLNQTIAAATWSFAHNLDDRYPVFTVYDSTGDIIVPNRVETVDTNNANIYFTSARTGTATAVIASSISQISSITSDFTNQTTIAVTHSLDTRNIHVSVYDTNYNLVVPESVTLDTLDTVVVTFPSAQSGTVVVAQGGHIISGSAITAISSSYILSTGVDGPLGMDSVTSASYALTASYGENIVLSGSIDLNGYTWPTQDGTYGVEVLVTDGAGGLTFELPTNVYETVKNVTLSTIVKGTPVHATGSGTSGNAVGVIPADALDPTKMPATYIAQSDILAGQEGLGIAVGFISGVDTRGLTEGEPVYVAAGGGWTQTKPTGSALIQNLGIVTKVAENGSGVVLGAGRSNDVPNIQQGYAWVGNGDQVATATPTASFFVTSGSHALNADQAVTASYSLYSLDGAHAATADEAINASQLDNLQSFQFLRSDQSDTLDGDLTVTGKITAQEFHTEFVSASIIYQSGSTQFGDSSDDTHTFTGSLKVEGKVSQTGLGESTYFGFEAGINDDFTANRNVGFGYQALKANTSGFYNTAVGHSSLTLNTSGERNTAIGFQTLAFVTTGDRNTALGYEAGTWTPSFDIPNSSDSIYIGAFTQPSDVNNTNEIILGFDTIGKGSNTTVIGKAGTTTHTYLAGIITGSSLDVTGNITVGGTVDGIDLQAFSSSIEQRATDLEAFSSSLDATFATDADLNLISASVDALNAATSSYALEANISGAFTSVSESIASDIAEIIDGTQTVTSASYALTASYALNVPVTASYALTASYIDPTFISASAAAEGFGQGGVTSIIAGTGISINQGTGDVTISALAASGSQGQNVIAPFAFARVATTTNSSGTGISWSNWNSGNGTLDFTFASSQPDTNYIVVTDGESNDDGRLVSIQNKTVNGFEASFYTPSGVSTPSAANAFTIIVYGSDPIATVGVAVTGSLLTTSSLSSNDLTFTKGDGTSYTIDLTSITPTSSSYAVTASYIDPTFISESAAAAGFGAGGGGGVGVGFPFSGSAIITGSLFVSGGLISGSFKGDGSQLTGIDVSSVSTVSQTFTSQTTVVVSHNFNSKDINVAVYNGSDQYIIPDTITLTDNNTATVTFAVPTSGRVVVVKGGHIVTALGLTSKAGSVATSSFSATGSSFYYDVTFESSFESANYSVALQAHSQFAVPSSFPGHAWVDSNKTAGGFRIVVPSFDDTTDEIHWSAIAHGESDVTASNATTASYILGSNVDGAVALATTASYALTASYASNVPETASYALSALTASYALVAGSGGGFPYSGSAEVTGSLTVSGSFVDFTQATVISGSIFSGSFVGDGTGLSGLGYGDTKKLNQTVAATTWSFSHNMNEQYPTVTVYNTNNEVVQPSKIEAQDAQTLKLYFGIPTAGTAVAVVGGVALTQEAGFNRVFSQGVAATTWSFEHNLGNKYPQVIVYDSNDDLVIPGRIQVEDQNNLKIYFDTPQAGTATATVGGTSLTASYANTLVVTDTLLSSQQNTDVDTGTETVATVSTSFYDGAFFDYVIKDGTNYRAGTVMAVWDGSSVQYADNSTADIGDTSGVTLSVDINGTDARLRAAVTSDNWNIKAFVRAL